LSGGSSPTTEELDLLKPPHRFRSSETSQKRKEKKKPIRKSRKKKFGVSFSSAHSNKKNTKEEEKLREREEQEENKTCVRRKKERERERERFRGWLAAWFRSSSYPPWHPLLSLARIAWLSGLVGIWYSSADSSNSREKKKKKQQQKGRRIKKKKKKKCAEGMCDEIGNNLASWSSMSQVHVDTVPSSSSSFVLEDDEDICCCRKVYQSGSGAEEKGLDIWTISLDPEIIRMETLQ
jgi:hypothetical protein